MFSFFSKKKDTSSIPSKILGVLEDADEAYMKAFTTKRLSPLSSYMTRDCLVTVSRIVYATGSRYFGAPKYRNTEWVIKGKSESGDLVIEKNVTFDRIALKGSLKVNCAQDYSEIWTFDVKENLISSIRSI